MEMWMCEANEVSVDLPLRVKKEGRSYLVLKDSLGHYFVTENMCSHARVPLHTGQWDPITAVITCAAHGARFDLNQGAKPLCAPAVTALQMLPCEVKQNQQDGILWVVAESDDLD